ncbi:hypothetical protein CLU96_1551 [Chryseobacterium sp. 52]|nr:hypothetical protein [Chryseobacterium sp. 52]PIF44574.1 hypothetical protein CLU96_1551 [Chryseobacterium sp. 52]
MLQIASELIKKKAILSFISLKNNFLKYKINNSKTKDPSSLEGSFQ